MKPIHVIFAFGFAAMAMLLLGCKPEGHPVQKAQTTDTASPDVQAPKTKVTFSTFPVPPEPAASAEEVAHGKEVYE